jgi:hypothetical protein
LAYDFDDSMARQPLGSDPSNRLQTPAEPVVLSPALQKFRSCRWRRAAENGIPECCSHRDVLPIAGARGFDAEAWCADCSFYKLRRTPRKPALGEDRF